MRNACSAKRASQAVGVGSARQSTWATPRRCTVGEIKAQRVVTSPESPNMAGWGRAVHLSRSHPFVGEPLLEQPPQETLITGLGGSLSLACPFAPQSRCCVEMRIWWFAAGFQVCLRKPGILRRLVLPEKPHCDCRPLYFGVGIHPAPAGGRKRCISVCLVGVGEQERQNRRLQPQQSAWLLVAGARLFGGKDRNKLEV